MGSKGPGEIMSIVTADRSWSKQMSRAGVTAEINRTTCHGGALNWGPAKKANRTVRGAVEQEAGGRRQPAVCSLRSEVIRRVSQAETVKESEIMA